MPRLLILCEYPTLLGGERSMLATLEAVGAADFDVNVAAPPAGPLAAAIGQHAARHVPWHTHDDAGERFPLERLRADLDAMIADVRPDLVHANSLSTSRIAGPVVVKRGVAGVGHLRDIVKLAPQAMIDVNAHRRLLAVSRAVRDFHIHQEIDATKCAIVYNGIDLDEFQPGTATGYLHRELQLPTASQLVAMIGQIGLRKGTDVALAAAWQVAAEVPDVHWLVVGERTSNKREAHEFEALVREIAGESPLSGRVHFLGTRTDVPQILVECDLLVHAARQEPLGRVLLEAAACGVAIVATDVGGTREIFTGESECGLLVPSDNRSALAEAILAVLRNLDLRLKLGRAARRRAEQAFDIRDAAARLIQQYQSALASSG
ncbi:MAG: glycosyltransferase family 4 protein [Pirellulales bacterium]